MNGNKILIDLAIFMTIVPLLGFIIKYFKEGVWSLSHLVASLTGILLLIASLIWRRKHKNRTESKTRNR